MTVQANHSAILLVTTTMAVSMAWIVVVCIAVIALAPGDVSSQIPTVCLTNLTNMVCCPDQCGAAQGRGTCMDISINMNSDDVRANWPHYFNRVCKCSGGITAVGVNTDITEQIAACHNSFRGKT